MWKLIQIFILNLCKKEYENIEELIVEKFCQYLTKCFSKKDTLIVAAAERQINLVNKIDLPRKQVVFSFFAQRQDIDKQQIVKLTKKAATFIADTDKTVSQLNSISSHTDYPAEVVQISPFDSRLELGHSQQVKKLKILLLVNRLDISDQKPVLSELIKTMKQNQLIELVLVDYQNTQTYWKKVVQQVIQQQKAEDLFVFADQQQIVSKVKNENDFNSTKRKIIWCFLQSEEDVIRQLSDTRLVIDLAKEPDLFLQIASISAGIPQINQVKTSYVEDHKNGLIIKEIDQLKQAINFYLVGLTNWNQALVYAAKRISEYSSKNLIKKWQKISKEAE
ncbi:accessory Sec system protein Asp1 [Liquorilactobacillus nagelii]|uniref:accessory Sec system protein Asp1 n=1 Tax=Liquorilactobacillus nagelii TaxID=82688 RepID=UPI00242B1933|nr:accessory Sec system protein Asp1 [Liquorilactobacillus nagelii]